MPSLGLHLGLTSVSGILPGANPLESIPDLFALWDTSLSASVLDLGGNPADPAEGVAQISDLTGNGWHLKNTTDLPVRETTPGIGGLDCVAFSAHFLDTDSPLSGVTDFTLFFLAQIVDATADSNELFSIAGSGGFMVGIESGNAKVGRSLVAWDANTSGGISSGVPFLIVATRNASGMSIRVGSGTPATTAQVGSLSGIMEVAAPAAAMKFAEGAAYSRILTEPEIATAVAHLTAKRSL